MMFLEFSVLDHHNNLGIKMNFLTSTHKNSNIFFFFEKKILENSGIINLN